MMNLLQEVLKTIISFIGIIFFHELGHILAGSFFRWRFHHMSFGPVKIQYNRVKGLRIRGIADPAKWGGAAAIMPENPESVVKEEVGTVILAGPIMSIIMAGLFRLSALPDYMSWMSLVIGIVTLIPFRGGNVYSDGGKLKQILSDGEACEIELAIFRIGSRVLADGDFTNVNPNDLRVLTMSHDLRDQYKGWYYMTLHYRDNGNLIDEKLAQQCLDEISTALPVSLTKKLRWS